METRINSFLSTGATIALVEDPVVASLRSVAAASFPSITWLTIVLKEVTSAQLLACTLSASFAEFLRSTLSSITVKFLYIPSTTAHSSQRIISIPKESSVQVSSLFILEKRLKNCNRR
jgi:hypothetical protein